MAQRHGFTLIEMLMVVIIGSVLMGVGSREFGRIGNQRAVANARDAMISTAFRARSEAARSGALIYLRVMPDSGTSGLARIRTVSGEVLHELSFADYGAKLVASETTVCYAARGYALPGCTLVPNGGNVRFARGADTTAVVVTVLGQIRRSE